MPGPIYRTYDAEALFEETILPIVMRCYYPDEFVSLIQDHGFTMTNRWAEYAGEGYGEGPELVVEFRRIGGV